MPLITKIRSYLFLFLVLLAPFHAFFITWLKSAAPPEALWVIIISAWREIIVVIICGFVVVELLKQKRFPRLDALDWVIIGYFALSLFWLPFEWQNKTQWIWGFRFDILPLIFYLFVRHSNWQKTNLIFRMAMLSALIVMIFGILHSLILPKNFLTHFGYSMHQGPYQPDIAIAACQQLEHTDAVCRATSTFGGPTRYGTYLLLVLGLVIGMAKKYQVWYWGGIILALINIVFTFSRSVWIGAFAMGIVLLFWLVPKKWKIAGVIGGAVILLAGFLFLTLNLEDSNKWNISLVKSLFIRDISTNEHIVYMKEGVKTVLVHPLGIGLGTVGPASVHFKKNLTENWYLQIAAEMGILGLVLFGAILVLMAKKLLVKGKDGMGNGVGIQRGLFLSLLGIAIAGLFTHSFEETTAVLMLFGIIGIALSEKGLGT